MWTLKDVSGKTQLNYRKLFAKNIIEVCEVESEEWRVTSGETQSAAAAFLATT